MKSHCQRIDCDWSYEFLCGDKCVSQTNQCFCGGDIISYDDTLEYVCCNNGTCVKDMIDGSVHCNGVKLTWRDPCNGLCKQEAFYGTATVSCENGRQCVREVSICKGSPRCSE